MRTLSFPIAVMATVLIAFPAISQDKTGTYSGMHGSASSQEAMHHTTMASSPDAAKAPFDLQILHTMAAHHKSAIKTAQDAQRKAQYA